MKREQVSFYWDCDSSQCFIMVGNGQLANTMEILLSIQDELMAHKHWAVQIQSRINTQHSIRNINGGLNTLPVRGRG